MDRTRVQQWIAGYERAWRTPGTETLSTLFTSDATYLQGPYHEPVVGLRDICTMWEAERDGHDEEFGMSSEIIAVDGDVAVARLEVRYGTGQEFRDLWLMTFAGDGRCVAFEEWPFSPPA
ncbi:nuclear transport factor 2 family protein [Plantactinospora sp. WMMB334]|uniref:nuclear transport factor 2 family protein n=1 Tax=Plantactinospora sp. WMMB334 TaxID=3404119 RepID=UPI003B945532